MNLKCPYCDCCYEIDQKTLGNPIGNEKLGYGWWLRCYRCHKKWWLKNSFVEQTINAPLKAGKRAKIERLNSFAKRRDRKGRGFGFARILRYMLLGILALGIAAGCYFKDDFLNYIKVKAMRLRENISNKLDLREVKYNIDKNNLITVSGDIVNTDSKNIMTIKGLKFNIFRKNEKIDSWDNDFEDGMILPQQSIPFSSSKRLNGNTDDITVEVLIY